MNATAIRLAALVFPLALMAAEPPVPAEAPAPESATAVAPPASAPASAPAPAPEPIPLPTLARSLESGLARVRFLERTATASAAAATVERSLATTDARLAELESSLRAAGPDEVTYRELDRMRIDWQELDATLAEWESSLEHDAKELDDARNELKAMDETWTATLADKSGDQVPAVLVEKIDALLLKVQGLRESLRDHAASLLLLQDEVSADRAHVGEALERLTTLSAEIGERLFAVENDPLWVTLLAERAGAPLVTQAAESWHATGRELMQLLRRHSGRFLFQLALFAVLAAGGSFLVRKVRGSTAVDPAGKEASSFLDHTVSAAFVLALFATFFIYPRTAASLHGAALTLLLLPYLRFLPKLAHPAVMGPAHGLAVVFILDRVHDFALPHSLLSRLTLLTTGVLGIACWAWALRNGARLAHDGAPAFKPRLRILVRIAIVFLAIAIVANIVGNVSLAEQLTLIAVKGAFAGGILYIVARILESLYVLLLAFLDSRGAVMVVRHRKLLERRGRLTIFALAAGTWIVFVLWIMRVIEQSGQIIASALTKKWTVGNLNIALGGIVAFVVALTLGIVVSRILRFILDEAVLPRLTLPRGVPAAISATVGYLVVIAGFVMAFLAAGLEMSQFTFLVGAFGVGIGFGLQNVVNNFVSGLILLYERPIQVGDVLEVGTLRGHVRRIGIRSSTLATFDGAEVIVPNATLIAADVVNWTLSDRVRRVDIPVGAGYGSDPRKVLAILDKVAKAHPEVLPLPAPNPLFVGFGDSCLNFELRFWTPEYDASIRVGSEVRTAIVAAFKEAGIEIPFPQRDLHVKSMTADAGRALTGQNEPPSEAGHTA